MQHTLEGGRRHREAWRRDCNSGHKIDPEFGRFIDRAINVGGRHDG